MSKENVTKMHNPKPTKEAKVARTAEQKAEKFRELAKKRTTRIVKAIRSLGNLASSNYVSTPEQRIKILAALAGAVADVEARYNAPGGKPSEPEFDL